MVVLATKIGWAPLNEVPHRRFGIKAGVEGRKELRRKPRISSLDAADVGQQAECLRELAAQINDAHRAVAAGVRKTLQDARRAGDLLLAAKEIVPHGQWGNWIEANCEFAQRTSNVYKRIAANWRDVEEQLKTNPTWAIDDVDAYLREREMERDWPAEDTKNDAEQEQGGKAEKTEKQAVQKPDDDQEKDCSRNGNRQLREQVPEDEYMDMQEIDVPVGISYAAQITIDAPQASLVGLADVLGVDSSPQFTVGEITIDQLFTAVRQWSAHFDHTSIILSLEKRCDSL